MKFIFLILLFLFTLNCSINKVSNIHGIRFTEKKYDEIVINNTNKNDVRKIVGPPSSKSEFNKIWFYFERKKEAQSIFKLGKQKISHNNIIILEFNNMGIVSKKEFLSLKDMNDIKIAEKITEKKFSQDNTLYNILSTVREKINAPSRQKK